MRKDIILDVFNTLGSGPFIAKIIYSTKLSTECQKLNVQFKRFINEEAQKYNRNADDVNNINSIFYPSDTGISSTSTLHYYSFENNKEAKSFIESIYNKIHQTNDGSNLFLVSKEKAVIVPAYQNEYVNKLFGIIESSVFPNCSADNSINAMLQNNNYSDF